jgi:hypothetical protein
LQRHEVSAAGSVRSDVIALRIARWLWVLIALLAVGGAVAATARVPEVAEGWAVTDAAPGADGAMGAHAVVLMNSSDAGRLRVGQPVTLEFPGAQPLQRSVTSVVPGVLDPAEARRRWASIPDGAIEGTSPIVAVLVPLAAPDSGMSAVAAGAVGQAEVEIGTRSVGSLLPLVGRFFR